MYKTLNIRPHDFKFFSTESKRCVICPPLNLGLDLVTYNIYKVVFKIIIFQNKAKLIVYQAPK